MAEDQAEVGRGEGARPRKIWPPRHPVTSARCSKCGVASVSILRTFGTGGGSVFRTLVDDVYCLRCGHMGQPDYHIEDIGPKGTQQTHKQPGK